MSNNQWDIIWPGRSEWIAHIDSHIPSSSGLIPDLLILIAEYGASVILTWTPGPITGSLIMNDFCSWRDIYPFNTNVDFYAPWIRHISGIASIRIGQTIIDLLSDHTWHYRTPRVVALSISRDQYESKHFKTTLPRDAYVIYDMSLSGDAAIKNSMVDCQNPIAIAHHVASPAIGRVTFRSDIF